MTQIKYIPIYIKKAFWYNMRYTLRKLWDITENWAKIDNLFCFIDSQSNLSGLEQ